MAPIPLDERPLRGVFDVVERAMVGTPHEAAAVDNVLWRNGRYAVGKRQLNAREIERYGLRSERRRC